MIKENFPQDNATVIEFISLFTCRVFIKIIEEKVKPVNPEDHDKPRKTITYQRGRFLGKGGFAKCYEVSRIEPIETEE